MDDQLFRIWNMAKLMNNNPKIVWVISIKCAFCFINSNIPVLPNNKNAMATVRLMTFFLFIPVNFQ